MPGRIAFTSTRPEPELKILRCSQWPIPPIDGVDSAMDRNHDGPEKPEFTVEPAQLTFAQSTPARLKEPSPAIHIAGAMPAAPSSFFAGPSGIDQILAQTPK